jgi:hypothetical protein
MMVSLLKCMVAYRFEKHPEKGSTLGNLVFYC